MLDKKFILDNNFIYYKLANNRDFESLSKKENKYFFDTENAPLFPKEIVEKYKLDTKEYCVLEEFQDVSKTSLLNSLLKEKKITTQIYVWQFGSNDNDKVYWGNTIQEFIDFIHSIDAYKISKGYKVKQFDIFVHNLAWDIEFFKYFFKNNNYTQIKATRDKDEKKYNSQLEYSFDITETDGQVHGALIQLEKKESVTISRGKEKVEKYMTTINFRCSAKITPMSLKKISKEMITVDEDYIKDGGEYQYNLVRNPNNYVPNDMEAWYIYCDIYLLKEWYNQFIQKTYIDNGIKPFTISQIAFDSILQKTYEDNVLKRLYFPTKDPKKVKDRDVYEEHFSLKFIENNPLYKEYLRNSYKGGHTTASSECVSKGEKDTKLVRIFEKFQKSKRNKIRLNNMRKGFIIKGSSIDITSSYPSQMNLKNLPFGRPIYNKGKYDYSMVIDRNNNELDYDYHFITIAFDGFKSKNKKNQFGLNVKLRGLTKEQQEKLKTSTNESAVHNIIDGNFVGTNKIKVKEPTRKKLIDKYSKRNFIVTITHREFEEWERNFDFYYSDKGLKKGVQFIDYVSFQSEKGHFKKGIDYFFKIKEENDCAEGSNALKENAKLVINSFYGKHCSRRDREQKLYDFNKDIICFQKVNDENINEWEDDKLYAVYYGSAVTSEGRIQLRETTRKIGNDIFLYSDTDSIKFEISRDELIKKCKDENIVLSTCKAQKELGGWDFEFEFDDLKVVGQKKYMYLRNGIDKETNKPFEWNVKCAGLPKDVRDSIKLKEEFAIGNSFVKKGKRKVIGGNLLIDISYSLNDLIIGC